MPVPGGRPRSGPSSSWLGAHTWILEIPRRHHEVETIAMQHITPCNKYEYNDVSCSESIRTFCSSRYCSKCRKVSANQILNYNDAMHVQDVIVQVKTKILLHAAAKMTIAMPIGMNKITDADAYASLGSNITRTSYGQKEINCSK